MSPVEPPPRPETVEVPAEPTPEMIDAGDKVMAGRYGCCFEVRPIYAAMLSARPTAAETGVDLRATLRRAINATDGRVSDEASDQFLALGAQEVERCIASLRAQVAELTARLADATDNAALNGHLCDKALEQRDEARREAAQHSKRIADLEASERRKREFIDKVESRASTNWDAELWSDWEAAVAPTGSLLSAPQGEADAEGGKDG